MKHLKFIIILAATLSTEYCSGQFIDSFSDGNFTGNPAWSGDIPKYSVVTGKLKLTAPAVAESAFLSVPSRAIHAGSWEFSLQMDFNPSSTNYARIYIVSDLENLLGGLKGYFVKAGGTAREVSLYRQNGLIETKIIDGADDAINVSMVKLRVRVTRSETGEWKLFTDVGLTGTFSLEGSVVDSTNTTSSYFGVVCTYTSTRSDKFWFDDFIVTGVPVPDTTAPSVISAFAPTANQINLQFSEPLERTSAITASNYLVVNLGSPIVSNLASDQKTVYLTLPASMTNGVTYSLQIKGISDLSGNTMVTSNVSCLFFERIDSHYKDIIFTELFPDPSPQIGLPAAEFVEIYNRSNAPFNVGGWKLTDGSSTAVFPSQIILPGEYWIITSSSSMNLFNTLGKTIGLPNFPTLNNETDAVVLKNQENLIIDSLTYTIDWYRDADKQQGGWSLELIDPSNPCGEDDNWMASEDKSGGTPGRQNAVFANKPDISGPLLLSVFPQSSTEVLLNFNEKLDKASLTLENFQLQPSIQIIETSFRDKSLRSIIVKLEKDLASRLPYTIYTKNILDCNKNVTPESSLIFGLSETADSLDLVVNEILFNPRSGGVDFVEINNTSDKFINLKNWKLGNSDNGILKNVMLLFTEDLLITPASLFVITTSPAIIKSQYPVNGEGNLYKTFLPGLSDDEGSVAILDDSGRIIDEVSYSKDWHSVFIKSDEGVSLERISTNAPSNDSRNWTSSSSSSGFATPGLPNSQHRTDASADENSISITPEIFSPEGGINNFVQIKYRFDNSPVANVKVYDVQGHLLKTIATNETLGVEGTLRWEGDRDDGTKARMGYYIIWFEIFNTSGSVKTFRKRVIVKSN